MSRNRIPEKAKDDHGKKELILTVIFITAVFIIMNGFMVMVNILLNKALHLNPDSAPRDFIVYGESIAALIGAYLVVEQLQKEASAEKQENLIREATFIKDYNRAFIENEHMTVVEMNLERFFVSYCENGGDAWSAEQESAAKALMKSKVKEPGDAERQRLIDYLVYLEGLANVIENNAMRIDNIDSLMGYRFFLAANNPVVQELELRPYCAHYRGIFRLYEKWVFFKEQEFFWLAEKWNKIIQSKNSFRLNLKDHWKAPDLDIKLVKCEINDMVAVLKISEEALPSPDADQILFAQQLNNINNVFAWAEKNCQFDDELDEIAVLTNQLNLLMEPENGRYGIPMYTEKYALCRLDCYDGIIGHRSRLSMGSKKKQVNSIDSYI